jgi:hypothetical protein
MRVPEMCAQGAFGQSTAYISSTAIFAVFTRHCASVGTGRFAFSRLAILATIALLAFALLVMGKVDAYGRRLFSRVAM